jgi:hypothetical protein
VSITGKHLASAVLGTSDSSGNKAVKLHIHGRQPNVQAEFWKEHGASRRSHDKANLLKFLAFFKLPASAGCRPPPLGNGSVAMFRVTQEVGRISNP